MMGCMQSPVPGVVDSRVHVPRTVAGVDALDAIRGEFEHRNPAYSPMRRHPKPGGKPLFIRTWAEEAGGLSLPRGGLSRVRAALRGAGVEFRLEDRRTEGRPSMHGRIPEHRVELWPHQREALEAAYARQNCIVRAPVGSGKTSMALALIARVNYPTIVIVPTRGLLDQWVKRAGIELGLEGDALGLVHGPRARWRLQPLTIAIQGTLAEHGVDEELNEFFGMVLCDEAQFFAARTFFAAVDPFRSKYRIAVSADHSRKDRMEFLTQDLFGVVAADIKQSVVEGAGHVLDVGIDVIPTCFDADWYGMGSGQEIDFDRLLKEMAADEERNALILEHVCLEVREGQQVLVMAHQREHCQKLVAGLVANHVRAGFLIGGDDYRGEFVQTRAGLAAGTAQVGVGTFKSIGTGIDMPAVGRVVAATPVAANRQFFNQVRGRACRTAEGKRNARMLYFWDERVFGLKHLENIVKWNRTVRVRKDGGWVEGREYLQERRRRKYDAA